MRNTRTRTLALVVVAALCLALPAVAKAVPARDVPAEPRAAGERVEPSSSLQEIVLSLFERLRAVVTGKPSGDDDQTPGSSMDPDGNRPDSH